MSYKSEYELSVVANEHVGTPILIVDDLQDNIDLLRDSLESAGYTTLTGARSGAEALKILEADSSYGLVMLDLMMPEMDGCETCRQITANSRTQHIPVIMITGASISRDEALIRSFDAGAIDFISKPLEDVELYGRMRVALTLYHERLNSIRKTRALEKSEERFRLAVSGANDGIWDLNLLTGEAYLSPNCKSMLGYEEHEIAGTMKAWEDLIHQDDRERVSSALRRHWQNQTSTYIAEHRMRTKDGRYKWVLSRGKTIWDESGRTVRMAGSTTDITSQKDLEIQLRHIQKMDSMGRFAGGIAHDFNNILSVISAYSQVVLEEPGISERVERFTREILNASNHASTLTRKLLSISRRSDIDLIPTNLNCVIMAMGEMLRRVLGHNIIYAEELDSDLLQVLADKNMIEQVILNLVINARDAMEAGTLKIETGNIIITAEEAAACKEATEGSAVRMSITDTGTGIDEATLAQIFEPFFTTKSDGKGTGLGLSSAYTIVRQHKGWIRVESEIGKGTTFSVFFPALNKPGPAPAPNGNPAKAPGGGETILLVEDENALRELAATILEGYNYRILAASCGPEAIDIWKKHKEEISLLLTDIVMPGGLSGIDIGEKLSREKPDLKIIYTSGYRLDAIPNSTKIRESGVFVPKPYIPSKLAKIIRETLDG